MITKGGRGFVTMLRGCLRRGLGIDPWIGCIDGTHGVVAGGKAEDGLERGDHFGLGYVPIVGNPEAKLDEGVVRLLGKNSGKRVGIVLDDDRREKGPGVGAGSDASLREKCRDILTGGRR